MSSSQTSSGYFCLHGIRVEVRWDDKSVGHAIHEILDYFGLTTLESAPPECHAQLSFLTKRSSPSLPDCARQVVQRNGIVVWRADPYFYVCEGQSAMELDIASGTGRGTVRSTPWGSSGGVRLETVNFVIHSLLILVRRQSVYPLHAAAVAKDKIGLLLVGESDSGKSTEALSVVRQGWDYLTDDSLFLRPCNGYVEARPLRRDFGLDQGSVQMFPEIEDHRQPFLTDEQKRRVDMDAVYPDQRTDRCTPRVLVFPTIVPQSETKLRPLSATDTLCRLMQQSILLNLNPQIAQAHLNVLRHLVDQVQSYELLAGRDLKQNPTGVAEILEGALPENIQEHRAVTDEKRKSPCA